MDRIRNRTAPVTHRQPLSSATSSTYQSCPRKIMHPCRKLTKHCDLEISHTIAQMPRLNQLRFDEVQFLPFRACHINNYSALLLIRPYHFDSRLLAHCEDRVFRWDDVLIIDAEENVSWLDTCSGCGPICMHVLKDPALAVLSLVLQVSCAQSCTT